MVKEAEGGICFAHRQRLICAPHCMRRPATQNPGREKATLLLFLFRPSNPFHLKNATKKDRKCGPCGTAKSW